MPATSKKQQKFMGIVRAIQKGEAPAGKFSKAAQKAAKSMKKSSVKKYAKTKHKGLPSKKEEMKKRITVKEVSKWLKGLEEFRYRKIPNVDARRVASFINNGINEKGLPKSLIKKWEHAKYGREKHLANKYVSELDETTKRDYKAEYKKFQSSTKAKKYRAELNKYNRQKGTYGNGDGKDASHKGGKIVGFEAQSKNRGRAEKSRLKKEVSVNEAPMELNKIKDAIKMFQKKIEKQGRVTNARDEEHLKNLIKLYIQMGGKGIKEGYSMRDLGLSPFFKKLSPDQRQAVSIALIMGGNMTGAVEAIEKIKKGLSKDKKVKNALKMANESVDETKMSDKELMKYALYIKKYKPDMWNHLKKHPAMKKMVKKFKMEYVKEDLDPYKDFAEPYMKPEYNLNLGAFVDHYQKFMKFMKKHKEVPDKNKREWALAIRKKVGQGMFNGHMNQMSNIMDLLQKGEKFRNLKESVNEAIKKVSDAEDGSGYRQVWIGVYKGKMISFKANFPADAKKHTIDYFKVSKPNWGDVIVISKKEYDSQQGWHKQYKESVNEAKLKLTKDKPKKITNHIWSAPKRILTKREWLRIPDMRKIRKNGVDYVATSIGPNRTEVFIPVVFESVNEGQKRMASTILNKFDQAYIKFSREIRDVIKMMDRSTGSKVDGKIIDKAYSKGLIPLDKLMQEWGRGQQSNPKIDEKVIKVSKKDDVPGNAMKMRGEEKIKKLTYSGSNGKGGYEIKGKNLNVIGIRPRDKGFFVRHFTNNTGFRKANLYYDGVNFMDKNKKF